MRVGKRATLGKSLKSKVLLAGVPERIRTSDPRIRNPVLYPAELRALKNFS